MKYAELKDLTLQELASRSNEMRRELFNLRLQKASAQLEKTARVRSLRKDIARVETAISQRRNQTATPAAP